MKFTFNVKGGSTPPEVFNRHLFWVIFVASCGSIIFGYDLAFMSGVLAQPSFIDRFDLANHDAGAIQAHMIDTFQWRAFFGVPIIYWFNERFGRRLALITAAIIFNVGVVLQMAGGGNFPMTTYPV